MTGAGSATVDTVLGRFEAEARSVNHRFLKATVRTSGLPGALDAPLEARVRRFVERGHVSAYVRFTPALDAAGAGVDAQAFARAARGLGDLARASGLPAPSVQDVLRLPGVLGEARPAVAAAEVETPAVEALDRALAGLVEARRREGAELLAETRRLLASVAAALAEVRDLAREVPALAKARLEGRLRELLAGSGTALDEGFVAREAALIADRADVREEIARLEAHLLHAGEVLDAGGTAGRKLDFLVQEMHREVNTIGSKCTELGLSRLVLAMKSDVEALREQVQNVE
jgi:uncharacterized protein (TIGR00255 family)